MFSQKEFPIIYFSNLQWKSLIASLICGLLSVFLIHKAKMNTQELKIILFKNISISLSSLSSTIFLAILAGFFSIITIITLVSILESLFYRQKITITLQYLELPSELPYLGKNKRISLQDIKGIEISKVHGIYILTIVYLQMDMPLDLKKATLSGDLWSNKVVFEIYNIFLQILIMHKV